MTFATVGLGAGIELGWVDAIGSKAMWADKMATGCAGVLLTHDGSLWCSGFEIASLSWRNLTVLAAKYDNKYGDELRYFLVCQLSCLWLKSREAWLT